MENREREKTRVSQRQPEGGEELTLFVDDVMNDFQEQFSEPKNIHAHNERNEKKLEDTHPQQRTPSALSVGDIEENPYSPQARLARIEKRIQTLDESHPEYIEERFALEEKKNKVKEEEQGLNSPSKTTPQTQEQMVKELLKREFSYIAPIKSPDEEDQEVVEKARRVEEIDQVRPPATVAQMPEQQRLREAARMRKEFIDGLVNTSNTDWYESPSQNRDAVNQYIYKTAEHLSGKRASDVDMNDVQTARLFLFNNAPEDVLNHPAYKYVESFYNYQNERGFSGKDVEKDFVL